eukprot:snap_masked-scaffold_1-processed-gene-1.2-mRNA-1 protein AED:1.00 eAED:1.00 QI:0/0/0/0/1/1/2/0/380
MIISCSFHSSLQALAIPLGLYPLSIRILFLYINYQRNKKACKPFNNSSSKLLTKRTKLFPFGKVKESGSLIDTTFETSTRSASEITYTETEKNYWERLTTKQILRRINIFTLVVYAFISFAFSTTVCPSFTSKKCLFEEDYISFILLAKQLEKQEYTDPFNIVKETKFSIKIPLVVSLSYFVFALFDPFKLNIDEKTENQQQISFFYGIILDFAILIFCILNITYPLTKVFRTQGDITLGVDLSFRQVIRNQHGKSFLRRYLINEFSVENLNFYETVDKWKKNFDKFEKESVRRQARNVYSRFFSSRSLNPVNVSYEVVETLRRRLDNEEKDIEKDVFDEAVVEIEQLIVFDSFPRFKRSELFREFLQQQGFKGNPTITL